MTGRRRRVRDRLVVDPQKTADFSPEDWCSDLLGALEAFPSDPAKDWRRSRDRLRRLIAKLRSAINGLPGQTRAAADQLTILELALASLNTGEVHPLLTPLPAMNRLPDSAAADQFRRVVLQCTEHMIASGMSRSTAFRYVAAEITARGQGALKGGSGSFSADTVKRWFQAARSSDQSPAENLGDAEWLDRHALNYLGAPLETARANVRSWLDDPRVRAVFPKVRKGGVLTPRV